MGDEHAHHDVAHVGSDGEEEEGEGVAGAAVDSIQSRDRAAVPVEEAALPVGLAAEQELVRV